MEYTVRAIDKGIWQITDALDNRAYLVVGQQAALLVDTCAGYGNLASVVRDLTSLPVAVALTHSHYDHVGGAYFFPEVFISSEDDGEWAYEKRLALEAYPQLVQMGTLREDVPFGPRDGTLPRVRHVADGDEFNLGGLTVQAVALPAHTPGSMGFLVQERRILLSGDAVTPIMCLFFPRSLGIEHHRQNLARMASLPFEFFFTGHHAAGFAKDELASFDAAAAFAQTHRGYPWRHALLAELYGTVYLPPCATTDVDSPHYRALIGP